MISKNPIFENFLKKMCKVPLEVSLSGHKQSSAPPVQPSGALECTLRLHWRDGNSYSCTRFFHLINTKTEKASARKKNKIKYTCTHLFSCTRFFHLINTKPEKVSARKKTKQKS